jgi:carboxylesterase type B
MPTSSRPSETTLLSDFVTSILGLGSSAAATQAKDHLIKLDYAEYNGLAHSNGVSAWLGMRYAAPPLRDLRFRAPADPVVESGIVEAKIDGPVCYSTGDPWKPGGPKSDDCLYISVFAPTDAREGDNLPVYFYIQGGGYNANSNCKWSTAS